MSLLANHFGIEYGVAGYIAQLAAALATARGEGLTLPSAAELTAYDESLRYLDSVGLLDRAKTYNVYGFGSTQFGTINIANSLTYRHTSPAIETIVFTPGSGVKSDLTANSYLNTRYKVNEYAGIETDITVIIYVSESSTNLVANANAFGSRGQVASSLTQHRIAPLATVSTGARAGYGAADNFANADHKGLYILTYNGTQSVLYKDWDGTNGVKDVQALTPTAPDLANDELLLGRNSSAVSGGLIASDLYDKNVTLLARFNAFTDADAINFKTAWDLFRAGVGLMITFAATTILWDNAAVTFNMA